ncbi:MAG TPA: carboxypeptidase-like regulatory domain-containing protein [Pyrinomonadaceae bacterium]|nr:carboxypeptidase-like regulatory domain-containing protein [Pyrinomonadaceae bacterium]
MLKLFSASLIIAVACSVGSAQRPASPDNNEPPNQGIAPKTENGIGRADVRVFDESGNPIRNAYVKLESTRTDGFFCESWGDTDAHGIIALPPIHMGSLKLKVKAKGYRPQELDVPTSNLGDPVRVTLKKK